MEKSSNHRKITGDFAEALVLYWLSKYGFECACVDHTGIDLIACTKDGSQRMGISVQGRSCYPGAEKRAVSLHEFEKARVPCKLFGLTPYAAIVVDGADFLRCFLLPLDHLETIAGGKKTRLWPMSEHFLEDRRDDPKVRWFEYKLDQWRWGKLALSQRRRFGLAAKSV
jgi:hypothetical protein